MLLFLQGKSRPCPGRGKRCVKNQVPAGENRFIQFDAADGEELPQGGQRE